MRIALCLFVVCWFVVFGGCNRPLSIPSEVPGRSEPITVLVTRADVVVAGATVVFHSSAGDVVATRTTDASGRATSDVPWDCMVTVIDPAAPNNLSTVTHVRPSTTPIELPLDGERSPRPNAGTLRVDTPATDAPAGTDHFVIETPCATLSTQTLPATVQLTTDCAAWSHLPVVVTAWTPNVSFEEPGRGLAFVAGFATGSTDFTLAPGPWSQACKQVNAYVTDPDRMALQFRPRLGGAAFHTMNAFCTFGAPAPGFTSAEPVPDLGEGVLMRSFGYIDGGPLRYATLDASYPIIPDSVEVGRSNPLLIGKTQLVAMDGAGARWTADSDLAGADVVLAKLTWIFSPEQYVTWRFVVPGTATEIAVPLLPAEVAVSLANPRERLAELRFLDASWVSHPDDIAPFAVLESAAPKLPESSSLRCYTQQFYPDAK
jgi:hypothetical protein